MIRPHNPTMKVDGEDYHINNGDRAARAEEALYAYIRDDMPDESHYRDLICDFMHLCDREGVDFDEALRRGISCYEEESGNTVPKDATPELLDAIRPLVAIVNGARVHRLKKAGYLNAARAAIAKATEDAS